MWHSQSTLAHKLALFGMSTVLVSLVTACVAVFRERPQTYGAVALLISIISFAFYVQ